MITLSTTKTSAFTFFGFAFHFLYLEDTQSCLALFSAQQYLWLVDAESLAM
jgi:hypothetical protein